MILLELFVRLTLTLRLCEPPREEERLKMRMLKKGEQRPRADSIDDGGRSWCGGGDDRERGWTSIDARLTAAGRGCGACNGMVDGPVMGASVCDEAHGSCREQTHLGSHLC